MKKFKVLLLCLLLPGLSFASASKKKGAKIEETPVRLVLTLVVDQFRADQMLKFQSRYKKDGYQKLMKEGAYYPFAQYPVLQNMTCPGHAMILSGSLPSRNKIALNEWFNPQTKKNTYCVDDEEFGQSPRRFQGDTLGDEMKLRWPRSKSVGVALKDRSAIMLVGKSADAAYWFDSKNFKWISSGYYKKTQPDVLNQEFSRPKKDEKFVWRNSLGSRPFERTLTWGTEEAFAHPMTYDETLAVALKALDAHQLGQDEIPDLLAVSLSAHDLAGHFFSPDSPESEELTMQEDRIFSELFAALEKKIPGGMNAVVVMLTADHGVAPTVETALALGLDAGRIDQKQVVQELNQFLKEKFGSCRSGDWIAGMRTFHIYYDPECEVQARFKRIDLEGATKAKLQSMAGVDTVIGPQEINSPKSLPPSLEMELRKSYVPGISGDFILVPKPFWYQKEGPGTHHMTNYTYDRTVPLVFWGRPFKPGVYSQSAQVIDGAPTLAHILRVLAPSQNEGRVLFEALQAEKF